MTQVDYIALAVFLGLWLFQVWLSEGSRRFGRESLNGAMARKRADWIMNSLKRDLKMIDTQIMGGLQNGTGFFASTSIIALGGCVSIFGALAGGTAEVDRQLSSLLAGGSEVVELKLAGLSMIFGYAFFKFGWAYRLFNYCSILFGALPMAEEARAHPTIAEREARRVIAMNVLAARNFNAGLRAIFLLIGYLGWFVSPWLFIAMSVFVVAILIRRQFFSPARAVLVDGEEQ